MERIISAFNNSLNGLINTFEQERAFREDVIIFALFCPLAIFSHFGNIEKAFLISSLFLILIAELINTAIEVIIDRISKDVHPLSKMAKDIGSGLVFVAFVNAIVVWLIIFFG
jgi:diacylglycerol kinase (ATP)